MFMRVSICLKSGESIDISTVDLCHIEVDGAIIWYPEVDMDDYWSVFDLEDLSSESG